MPRVKKPAKVKEPIRLRMKELANGNKSLYLDRSIQQDFGGIDVLVNNAGVVDDAYLLMIKDESLERSLDINIKIGRASCRERV